MGVAYLDRLHFYFMRSRECQAVDGKLDCFPCLLQAISYDCTQILIIPLLECGPEPFLFERFVHSWPEFILA